MEVRKVWNSTSDLQGHSVSLLLVLFIGHITAYDLLLVCHCNCECILYRFQYIISYFPKTRGHVTLITTHLAVIYHVCASTDNISLHACAHNGLDSPAPKIWRGGLKIKTSAQRWRPFGHNRHAPKIGGAVAFSGQLGPHLTQCGRGLPPCQVSSLSIQPFGHNTPTFQTGQDRTDIDRTQTVR